MMQCKISKNERQYLEDGVQVGVRNDGRACMEYRSWTVETGVLPLANGSARIVSSDGDAIIGVKCELVPPSKQHALNGNVKISVDCSASIGFELEGRSRDSFGFYLSDLLTDLCTSSAAANKSELFVKPHLYCWCIYVDVTVLKSGGSLCDLLSVGIRAALADTIIPKVSVYEKEEKSDISRETEYHVEADERESMGSPFPIDTFPICVSVGLIKDRFVWDMTMEEEASADAIITAAVNSKGECIGLHKSGMGIFSFSTILTVIQSSQAVGQSIIHHLETALELQQSNCHGSQPRLGFMV